MSAVIKEKPVSDADENTDPEVIEPKTLAEILVISDQLPDDFYKNTAKYQGELDQAIATAKSLVHEITDEGRKLAKSDAAIIRKYAKTTNGFSLSVFRSLTDKVKAWKDDITGKTKQLETEADNIMARFEKIEAEKLKNIENLLVERLAWHRDHRDGASIREDFYTQADLKPMIKLSGSLTDKGALTNKADSFVKAIADNETASQNRFDSRILILENRCLRAEINPPLTQIHFGSVFYAEDDVFDAKVEELINTEIERRAEMAARIEKQNAAANQKRIDDALRDQQAEAERIARENALKENPEPEKEIVPTVTHQQVDTAISQKRTADDDRKNPPVVRATTGRMEQPSGTPKGTRTVLVTMVFEWDGVTENTSNIGVEGFLKRKLPAPMQERLKEVSSRDA